MKADFDDEIGALLGSSDSEVEAQAPACVDYELADLLTAVQNE